MSNAIKEFYKELKAKKENKRNCKHNWDLLASSINIGKKHPRIASKFKCKKCLKEIWRDSKYRIIYT